MAFCRSAVFGLQHQTYSGHSSGCIASVAWARPRPRLGIAAYAEPVSAFLMFQLCLYDVHNTCRVGTMVQVPTGMKLRPDQYKTFSRCDLDQATCACFVKTCFQDQSSTGTAVDGDAGLQQGDCCQPSDQWASPAGDSRQRAGFQGWPRTAWILSAQHGLSHPVICFHCSLCRYHDHTRAMLYNTLHHHLQHTWLELHSDAGLPMLHHACTIGMDDATS